MNRIRNYPLCILMLALALATAGGAAALTQFTEVTAAAGVLYTHSIDMPWNFPKQMSGGIALGDCDGDGYVDLFAVRGHEGSPLLLMNQGNGTFTDNTLGAGLDLGPGFWSAPAFGDLNGDGHLDLALGGVEGTQPRFFENDGNGVFTEITGQTGIVATSSPNTFSTSFGDFDRDGDLDLLQGHWTNTGCTGPGGDCLEVLWQNNGDGTFTNLHASVGILDPSDRTFSPNFADINNDGWPDLLFTSDFGNSQTYINDGDGTFTETTDELVITDEFGMGTAIGDYDNDGFLDWFNSSIWGGTNNGTGNRLYRNLGDGTFEDTTDAGGGVRDGSVGWSACFADFNNDMHLDLFHVDGMAGSPTTFDDPSRLFIADGNGGFTEEAATYSLADLGAGKGVACFDYDNDGDIDILSANNNGDSALWRNDGGNDNNWFKLKLRTRGYNRYAVGARAYVTVGAVTQMRDVRMGTNFQSQNPLEMHFGLGSAAVIDELKVVWNDGTEDVFLNVGVNQAISMRQKFPGYLAVYDPAAEKVLFTDSNDGSGAKWRQYPDNGLGLSPVAGDWIGDAVDTIGLFDDSIPEFKLWNSYSDGPADIVVPLGVGGPGSMPISGDWDGDGVDSVGIWDPATSEFHMWNSTAGGAPDLTIFTPAGAAWVPIAGDWDGDEVDTYGFYDPVFGRFYLRNTNDRGGWDFNFRFGPRFQDWNPVVGDWDEDGIDTVGIHRPTTADFQLRNSLTDGPPDLTTKFGPRGADMAAVARSWVND